MRSIHRLLWQVALTCVVACRLDLGGEDSADDTRDQTSAAQRDGTAGADSRSKAAKSDDSKLSCASAAILRTAREYNADMTHLSGAYHVSGRPTVTSDVTIEPGTIFIFDADSSIEFGWNNHRMTLTAQGTKDAPIQMCSDEPLVGRWQGLILSQGLTTDSVLEHVQIYDAGSNRAALTIDAPAVLTDVQIHGSKKEGVLASNFGEGSSGLSIEGAQGAALVLRSMPALVNLPGGLVFGDNVDNAVHIRFGHYQDGNIHLPKQTVPYIQDQSIIASNVTIEIDAGVDYRFAVDSDLEIGWNSNKATLRVLGTAADPVVFSAESDKVGGWGSLLIDANVSTDSELSHVQVLQGGKAGPPIEIDAPILVNDLLISDCASSPVIDVLLAEGSANLTVQHVDGPALISPLWALTGLPRGGTFTGNTDDSIQVPELSPFAKLDHAIIPNLGVPYFLTGNISIGSNAHVTVEPGVEFIVDSGQNYTFELGWNSHKATFIAQGTASAPIVFRGVKDGVGTWGGIVVGSQVSTDSSFSYVNVKNAGLKTDAAISIQNSSFSQSADFGILKRAANTTDYAATNTFAGNTKGDVGTK